MTSGNINVSVKQVSQMSGVSKEPSEMTQRDRDWVERV